MATILKLRGLDRGKSVVSDGSATGGSLRGFKVPSALGPSVTGGTSVRATLDIGTTTAGVKYTSKIGGVKGNSIQVAHLDNAGNNNPLLVTVAYAATTGAPTINVQLATDGAGTPNSTANQVVAAVNASAEASQFVTASALTTGAGTAVVGAAAALANGANGTGTSEPFYQNVNSKSTVLVDVDDQKTVRTLKRNANRFVSLGAA
jgi:hypothetical protein